MLVLLQFDLRRIYFAHLIDDLALINVVYLYDLLIS